MFDLIGLALAASVVLIGVAVILVLGLPFVLSEPAEADTKAWRDPAPPLFRMLLPLARVYAGLQRRLPDELRARIGTRLNAAGLGYAITPEEFVIIRWLLTVIATGMAVFVYMTVGSFTLGWMTALAGLSILGYFYCDIWLHDQIKKRHHQMSKQFPFFMEILVLCMRAGLTFPSAVQQATGLLPNGPVKEEFVRYLRETRTGMRRREALDHLADRCQLAGVRNFVSAVNQAEETGAALGDVLADQAEQRRQERFLKAENQANKAPVKMLFPLVAFLFPITFVIIMFPIVIQMMETGSLGFLR